MIKTEKGVWCHFKALLVQWNDKSTRNSAYFQETRGPLANCWKDNESISVIESIFHNVRAFCLSKLPFYHCRGMCSDFSGPTNSLCKCPSVLGRFRVAGVRSQNLQNKLYQLVFAEKWTKSLVEKLGFAENVGIFCHVFNRGGMIQFIHWSLSHIFA